MTRRLLHDRRGASAAEFALLLPLLILLLFGMIDVGRFMWQWNAAEKAAQAGVRFAAVTDVVSTGLGTFSFVGTNGLTQGDVIPADAIAPVLCTDNGTTATCTCTASGASICPTGYATGNHIAFQNIVNRMTQIDGLIKTADVKIEYRGSGLGYAGDPNGMDIAPLVRVMIDKIDLSTLSSMTIMSISIKNISATMTAEDSSGTVSN